MIKAVVGIVACLALVAGLAVAAPTEKSEKKASAEKKAPAEKKAVAEKKASAAKEEKEPDWKLAVQAWTYNRLTLFEAIDKTKALGVKYIEAFPGQTISPDHKDLKLNEDLSAEGRKLVKEKLHADGVKLVNYGVTNVGDDEKSARKLFEFAKEMGIRTIVAEPQPKMMATLDKLTEEYKINVAIHNHPKPSHYWNADTVLEAIKGHSKRIGACADTGHWVRSGLDPVECIKKLDGHIISLHLKDVNEKGAKAHDVPYGTGVGEVKAVLTELKKQGFTGVFAIEYEYNVDNPTPDVEKCVAAFHELVKEVNGKGAAAK